MLDSNEAPNQKEAEIWQDIGYLAFSISVYEKIIIIQ